MSTVMTVRPGGKADAIETALIVGDLSKLGVEERLNYYNRVCESLGLNPLTQPFAYITLNGKLTLYAKRDATEQLRKVHGVSISELEKTFNADLYIVTAKAVDNTGRCDVSTGAVNIGGLKGENLANAIMKAETKAKRRVTLSICGLGLLDETEVSSIPGAVDNPVWTDGERKEIVDRKLKELKAPKPEPDSEAPELEEIEGWKKVISACVTPSDFNALIPQVKDKSNVIKMALMTASLDAGLTFDRSLGEFVAPQASQLTPTTNPTPTVAGKAPSATVKANPATPAEPPALFDEAEDDSLTKITCHVTDVEKRKKKAGGEYWLMQCDVEGAQDSLAVQVWDKKLFDAAQTLLGKDAVLGCRRKETADKVFYSLEVIYQ